VTGDSGVGPGELGDNGQHEQPAVPGRNRPRLSPKWLLLWLAVIVVVLDVVAVQVSPPFPAGGEPGQACSFPECYVRSAIELPPPEVVADFQPDTAPSSAPMFYFHPSISSTILTMWIVMAVLLLVGFLATRRMRLVPRGVQNVVEWAYEFGMDFTGGFGGEGTRRYYPVFAGFFVLILACNWSGLVPPIGKIPELRAPTSDVNITIGLAAVSFVIFEGEGFRRCGVRSYLSKFFPIGEFRHGLGAGVLGMYVGFIELFLEFVKPVVLAMRLFGNIYGGEVALAVITALTIGIIPVALMGLELLLNLIQALIFSILTLVFILMAVESHEPPKVERPTIDPVHATRAPGGAPGPTATPA
jgi:F-type H+-transporting ATPase subunit a